MIPSCFYHATVSNTQQRYRDMALEYGTTKTEIWVVQRCELCGWITSLIIIRVPKSGVRHDPARRPSHDSVSNSTSFIHGAW